MSAYYDRKKAAKHQAAVDAVVARLERHGWVRIEVQHSEGYDRYTHIHAESDPAGHVFINNRISVFVVRAHAKSSTVYPALSPTKEFKGRLWTIGVSTYGSKHPDY